MISLQTAVLTLAAVLLGWLLKEMSEYIRLRRDDCAIVGRALIYLAEVRHRLLVIPAVFEMLGKGLNLSCEDRMTVAGIIPPPADLHGRFEVALDVISGRRPEVAFRILNKDKIEDALAFLRRIVNSTNVNPAVYEKFETQMLKEVFQNLDEAILQLAWLHGLNTSWVFGRQVRRWNDPKEFQVEMGDTMQRVLAGALQVEDLAAAISL
jgi:hypothetical protein